MGSTVSESEGNRDFFIFGGGKLPEAPNDPFFADFRHSERSGWFPGGQTVHRSKNALFLLTIAIRFDIIK